MAQKESQAKARDERRERRVFRLSERNVNVAPTVSTAPTEEESLVAPGRVPQEHRERKLKVAYGTEGRRDEASSCQGGPWRPDRTRRPEPAPQPPSSNAKGKGQHRGIPRIWRPWTPTGSTRPDRVENFGRFLPPTKELLEALAGLTGTAKAPPGSSCTSRLSRPSRPCSAPSGGPFRRRNLRQAARPGSPRPWIPPWSAR
ncbi:unnamed protein product [Durusdinium trenchii]|uniref:Uncharacterized protein n=1 Tax=Durusdinium trenchii TaxID=1381693 RepID=A0ABP0LAS5_9DINO